MIRGLVRRMGWLPKFGKDCRWSTSWIQEQRTCGGFKKLCCRSWNRCWYAGKLPATVRICWAIATERCLGRLGRNFITQTFPVPATRAATKSRHVQAGVQIAVRPSLSCLACALQARLVAVSRTAGGFGPFWFCAAMCFPKICPAEDTHPIPHQSWHAQNQPILQPHCCVKMQSFIVQGLSNSDFNFFNIL